MFLMFIFNIFLHFHLILVLTLKAKMTYPMFYINPMVDIKFAKVYLYVR